MYGGDGGCPSVKGQLVNSCLKPSQLTLGNNSAGTDGAFAESIMVISKPFADIGRGYLKHLIFEGPNIKLLYLSKHGEIGVDLSLLSQFARQYTCVCFLAKNVLILKRSISAISVV